MGDRARQVRAGACGLQVLSDPINVAILRQIGDSRRDASELVSSLRGASRSTCFNRLRDLEAQGLLVRETLSTMPRRACYWLPEAGDSLLGVADDVERWLAHGGRPATPDTTEGSVAIKAIRVGWNVGIIHRLGERPASLTQLDADIPRASYHHLRHAIRHLLEAGLVQRRIGRDGRRLYRLTSFGHRSAAALASAIRWESSYLPESSPPLTPRDSRTLLVLPAALVNLPADVAGTCRLQVESFSDVTLEIAGGRVVGWATGRNDGPHGVVRGSRADWREAIAGGDLSRLEISGDDRLATEIVRALRDQLLLPSPDRLSPA